MPKETKSGESEQFRPESLSFKDTRQRTVLEVEGLCLELDHRRTKRTLVNEVAFDIARGEMLALIGESGSGKSLTAAAIGGLLPRTIRASGGIRFEGFSLHELKRKERRCLLGKDIGWIFQDYQGSFTPYLKIGSQLKEALLTHRRMTTNEAKAYIHDWLDKVGLPAERAYASYPFQLSGGQRQRAAIAAALMTGPSLLIADEPTAALDVLTGARIMDLLARMQEQTGCAVLMITHDLRLVRRRAERIAVMRQGRIVERGNAPSIWRRPAHPYTKELLLAVPTLSESIESKGGATHA
ncbi:ABC transporter ATP-binding protein [Cohnella sp. LGH]|uniref:ABC transporter ATP-binding protein n=1 Tax=Cohnella sp. LGH TaxID=1619153 RepID=UPI001ADB36F6|nr:ABC transporter ATP-binding protein [Cohnella sp. LGH]QTH45470.1 ABC transporter ATP-binding protein [Cohnella sp. LGH]